MEIFGSSVSAAVRAGMQQTYAESMKTFILPAYEKANAELFKQLYDTFNKGTIAYTNQMTSYTKMYEPIHAELVSFMRSVPEKLQLLSDSTVNTCTQRVGGEINKDLKIMQTNLLKTLKENIKSEVSFDRRRLRLHSQAYQFHSLLESDQKRIRITGGITRRHLYGSSFASTNTGTQYIRCSRANQAFVASRTNQQSVPSGTVGQRFAFG